MRFDVHWCYMYGIRVCTGHEMHTFLQVKVLVGILPISSFILLVHGFRQRC